MAAPLTGFEQRGRVAPWTSRAEEEQWITDLLAYTDKWTVETVGQSVEGNPMRLFKIGTGPRTILHVSQQHGSELASRDTMFTTMREWTDSTDPDLADYLSKVTVLIMPTCHPDNLEVRENSNGVNTNRDHVKLSQPETQATHSAIRKYDPDVVLDWHEGANISRNYATAPQDNLNTARGIAILSQEMSDLVKSAIEGAGHTWELYQGPNRTTKGPEYLPNNLAVRNRVSLLLETARKYGDDTTAAARHTRHLISMGAIWRWHRANVDRCHSAIQEAETMVAARQKPLVLHVGTSYAGPEVSPLPDHYILSPEQVEDTALHRELFGITGYPDKGGYIVPLAQPAQNIIAYLMDPLSPLQVVAAQSGDGPPTFSLDARTITGYLYRRRGVIYEVTGGVYRQGDKNFAIELPLKDEW